MLATLLLVAGLVASHVTISKWDERTPALPQGPPPAVALQAVDRAKHEGPADEVVIWAEADLASPLVVAIGEDFPARRVTAFPLYRVGDTGAEAILAGLVLSLLGHWSQDGIRDLLESERTAGRGRPAPRSWSARLEPLPSREEVSADDRPIRRTSVVENLAGVLRRIRSPR